MKTPGYFAGIDIGTTSTKAILFDAQGLAWGRQAVSYPLHAPESGAAEQDPDAIAAAVLQALAGALEGSGGDRRHLRGLAFSSAMHSLLAVDAAGRPLTPSYTWADQRGQAQARAWQRDRPQLPAQTGLPLHPMSPLVKLGWLRATQPEVWQRAARFVSIKEYVLYQLCGVWAADWAIAAASGLLKWAALNWEPSALELAGLTPARLSPLVATDAILPLRPEVAARLHLDPAVPVLVGASDGVLANLGLGVEPGEAIAVSLGTSGAARATVRQPRSVVEQGLFCYPLRQDYWVLGGATNSGGLAWRWLRDRWLDLPADTGDAVLDDLAASVPPGADGLIFHPYLTGERAPLWSSGACGSFFGLRFDCGRAQAARAVLEGVLYNLALVVAATRAASGATGPIWATGGVWRSPLWPQTLAEVCNCEVWVPAERESACWGAARWGWAALGISAPRLGTGAGERYHPNPERAAVYQTLRQRYARLLTAFKPLYADLEAPPPDESC